MAIDCQLVHHQLMALKCCMRIHDLTLIMRFEAITGVLSDYRVSWLPTYRLHWFDVMQGCFLRSMFDANDGFCAD